jgi:hypothetical protein
MRRFKGNFLSRQLLAIVFPNCRHLKCDGNSLKSFMYSGTSGVLAKFVVRVIFRMLGLGFIHRTIVVNKSLDQFHEECKIHKLRLSMMCWVIDKLISNAGLALLAGEITIRFLFRIAVYNISWNTAIPCSFLQIVGHVVQTCGDLSGIECVVSLSRSSIPPARTWSSSAK